MSELEYIEKYIFTVTKNLQLKHQIKFGKSNLKQERIPPIKESTYKSNTYSNDVQLKNIKIDTSDYLVLEYTDENTKERTNIYFSYPHLFNLERILKTALEWFYSDKYKDLYIYKDDEINFNNKYNNLYLLTDISIGDKEIMIKPVVVYKNETYQEGILLNLNDDASVYLDIDELESFYYVIKKFDLYTNSIILASYGLNYTPKESDNNPYKKELRKKIK